MSSFQEALIGDVCAVGDGAHSKVARVNTGVPYLTSKNIGQGILKLNKLDFISKDSFEKLFPKNSKATRRPQPGGVLFGIIGTFGNTYLYKDGDYFGFSSSIGILRPDPDQLDSEYLYYVLSSRFFKSNHANHNSGSVQGYTNISTVKSLPLPLPQLDVQKKISTVLKSLDKKIELNRQTNQILEHIAQAIFKSWFVDFEPTRAKLKAKQTGQNPERAAMAAISGKTLDELDHLTREQFEELKTTAALFPDALVDSELGEIPEGWEVKTIEQISVNVAMGPFGSNIKVETFVDEGIPIINGQQLRGMMLKDGENKFITHDHADNLIKSNVFCNDIVITHRGTLGQVSIVPENSKYDRYIVSQSQCYVRPNKELVSPLFLILYFRSYIGQHELLAHKSQVGVPAIAKPVTNIRKIELTVPKIELSNYFQELANSLQVKISEGLSEMDSLVDIRDALLQRLLSGELSTELTKAKQ